MPTLRFKPTNSRTNLIHRSLFLILIEYNKMPKQRDDNYLNNKLECACYISIAADHNDNVYIADSHVKERATSNLPNRACTKFFRLHYMHPKGIHHISPENFL